jgi:dihydroflavonol-4-reductase
MILLTGATGLLGSHFALYLVQNGYSVKAVKRENSNLSQIKQVFNFYDPVNGNTLFSKISWISGDLTDVFFVESLLNKVDTVIHAAALVSSNPKDKKAITEANVSITENLVNESVKQGVKQFVFISSTAAVGSPVKKNTPVSELDVLKPNFETSVYSLSKFLAEMEVWRAFNEGLNGFILNPCVVLGPGDINKSSLTIVKRIARGFRFYTEGSNAVVDARDVADILLKLLSIKDEVNHERFLVIGEHISFQNLFNLIADALNKKRPSIKATRLFTSLYWRVNALFAFILGRSPGFTKANAESAHKKKIYNTQKLENIVRVEPRSAQEAIENTVNYLRKTKQV